MIITTKDIEGINKALETGLVIHAMFNNFGRHRKVILIDPREEPESDRKIYGYGNTGDFEYSLITASKSFLNNGKLSSPIYLSCGIGNGCQSFSDRFLTCGGSFRGYQKENKNKLTLRNSCGNYLIQLETDPDFAETINFMESLLHKRKDLFMSAWGSLSEIDKRSYQNPESLFL